MTRKAHSQVVYVMILAAVTVIALAAAAVPGDSTSLRELPRAVRKTIRAHLDGAKIIEIELEEEDGGQIYEIEAEKDGRVFEFAVSPTGKFLGFEDDEGDDADHQDADDEDEGDEDGEHVEAISLDEAPAAVRARLKKFTSPEHVEKVERITEADDDDDDDGDDEAEDEDEAIYEIEFAGKHGAASVTMTSSGDLLEIEHAVAHDDLPPAVLEELMEEYPNATIKEADAVQGLLL